MQDDWGLGTVKEKLNEKIKKEAEEYKQEQNANKHNVFQIISSIIDKKFIPTDEELEKMSSYLFTKYFSNDPTGLTLVNELNIRDNIPKKWEYWFMRIMMPRSIRYIRYNKKSKYDDEEFMDNLCHYYKCNEKQAEEYLKLLPDEEIEKIRKKYKYGVL